MNIKKYITSLIIYLILLTTTIFAQGITIGNGTTLTLGANTLTVSGSWDNSGTFAAASGTVIFASPDGNQTISKTGGETFDDLVINKAAGDIQLLSNVSVNNALTLTSGDIDLNGNIITLGSSASFSETSGNTVKGNSGGYITCTKNLNAPDRVNILGAVITSAIDLGSTTVKRGHVIQTLRGGQSISRYYDISPATNSGLNATLEFNYDESELNVLSESHFQFYCSTDDGTSWTYMTGTVNTTNNTVTLNGIDHFSRWTISSAFAPMANLKAFLQGAFLGSAMTTTLNYAGLIPLSQPYNTPPWNYAGTESVASIPLGVVDWVLVELRTGTEASTTIASRAGFIKSDGSIVDLDGSGLLRFSGLANDYYVVIRHRNHAAIMSATPVNINSTSALYSFAAAQSQAYGTNPMKDLGGGAFGMYAGDTNASGVVDVIDRGNTWDERNQSAVYSNSDTDLSGSINTLDIETTWNNRNITSKVP